MQPVAASYREFAPCEGLKDYVRAFFSFIPGAERKPARRAMTRDVVFGEGELLFLPMFADGHASLVFNLGLTLVADGVWQRDPGGCNGRVIGAVSRADHVSAECPTMIGVYFHAARAPSFTSVPAYELTDRVVPLPDLWGDAASELSLQLAEMDEAARIDCLESELLRRIETRARASSSVNLPGLAASVVRSRGRVTMERLANEAGVSRQQLARLFRDRIGVSPKLYCRLARFQPGLAFAGSGKGVDWAQVALELGYADQSHMIAEFREFSGLTPQMLATRRWFHPFIERARLQGR
jgi:AraC-like DNA-binding protein